MSLVNIGPSACPCLAKIGAFVSIFIPYSGCLYLEIKSKLPFSHIYARLEAFKTISQCSSFASWTLPSTQDLECGPALWDAKTRFLDIVVCLGLGAKDVGLLSRSPGAQEAMGASSM